MNDKAEAYASIYSEIGLREMKFDAFNKIGEKEIEIFKMELGELHNPNMKEWNIADNRRQINELKYDIKVYNMALDIQKEK